MTATVFAPLKVEYRALSRPGSPLRVVRTGMGPARAAVVADANADAEAFVVAGVGGGLAGPARPGDIVVASEVRGPARTVECPSAPLLAGALRRLGLTVHTGPLYTNDRVVNGARRRQLAGTGA